MALVYGDGTTENGQAILSGVNAGIEHDYVINYSSTTVGPVYVDGVLKLNQTSLYSPIKLFNGITRIGAPLWSTSDSILNGQIATMGYLAETWGTDEAVRYHNGDDPVDCQQRSIS